MSNSSTHARPDAEFFIGLVGDTFDVSLEEESKVEAQVTLLSCTGDENFKLVFQQLGSTSLEQGMFWFRSEKLASYPIFIVPIEEKDGLVAYEAIFN